MELTKPEWLKVGAHVKLLGWCGEIIEVAHSNEVTYVRIFGAKSIYHGNLAGDFVAFDEELIEPASPAEVAADLEKYVAMEKRRLQQMLELRARVTDHQEDFANDNQAHNQPATDRCQW